MWLLYRGVLYLESFSVLYILSLSPSFWQCAYASKWGIALRCNCILQHKPCPMCVSTSTNQLWTNSFSLCLFSNVLFLRFRSLHSLPSAWSHTHSPSSHFTLSTPHPLPGSPLSLPGMSVFISHTPLHCCYNVCVNNLVTRYVEREGKANKSTTCTPGQLFFVLFNLCLVRWYDEEGGVKRRPHPLEVAGRERRWREEREMGSWRRDWGGQRSTGQFISSCCNLLPYEGF